DNDGNVLIPPTCLSIPLYESNVACHAALDSQQFLHIVWEAVLAQQGARFLYTKMDTSGNTVVPPMLVVYPPHTFWAIYPCIAADYSNRLHLVWADGRIDTVLRIFYKRGENENTVEETARLKTANLSEITVFPNPFSKLIKIKFQTPTLNQVQGKSQIALNIYDATGRVVRSFPIINLCNPNKSVVSVYWQGTDNAGNHLPAGVYFIRITSSTLIQSVPVILLR
ncbi:T9SS type A sorting domain-containing protein, partial [candidate division WOR-3 bacterium]|nr:T9SS type A sorting domain-containing protein [candidate division WOR-3 bacterium]